MECVILVRMHNDTVLGISDDDHLATFSDMDSAIEFAEEHALCKARPYQIVELDEL